MRCLFVCILCNHYGWDEYQPKPSPTITIYFQTAKSMSTMRFLAKWWSTQKVSGLKTLLKAHIGNKFLPKRYGDMMSRPGSMMMGGGIGGFMPMSRCTPFLWQSFLIFIENFIDHHFQNQHQSRHVGDFRPTSRTGSRPSSGAGGRGPGEGASGVEDDAYGDKNMMMKQTHMNDRHTRTVDIHKR